MSESASMFDSPPERARETVRVRECAFVKVFVNGRGVGRSSEVKVRVCVREGLFMRENERGGESLPERERERKSVERKCESLALGGSRRSFFLFFLVSESRL